MAIKLIEHETPDALERTTRQEWYEYLWNQLGTRKEDFLASNLSIITFNYDRSLEYSLYYSLQASFDLNASDAAAYLNNIPITHVYGQLGKPDFLNEDGRPYTPDVTRPSLKKAVSGIEIVFESEKMPIDRAEDIDLALSNAEVVCFLGFGYNKTNVDRLGINKSVKGKQFFGTAYRLLPDENRKAQDLFPGIGITIGHEGQDIMTFIRTQPVFG